MTEHHDNLANILPGLHALSRADKLRVIQYMAADLAQDEGIPFLHVGASYPVWTPIEAYAAGDVLLKLLESEGAAP